MKQVLLIVLVLVGIQSLACRFTIREIGYSNLYLEEYQLVLEADSLKHKTLIDDFKSIAFAYSIDANVKYRFVAKGKTTPEISFFTGGGNKIYSQNITNTQDILNSVTTCLNSPLRQKLIDNTGQFFATIIYFESGHESDKKVEESILEATKKFTQVSPHLDKAVSEEINVIRLPVTQRKNESIILNALGVEENNQESIISIIYGRGRLAGQVLLEGNITSNKLFNRLVLLGTDCECGIDLSPLLENTLPVNWPVEARQNTAKMLGFDVDNPIILAEMSRILAKGAATNKEKTAELLPQPFEIKKQNKEDKEKEEDTEITRTFSYTIIVLIILFALILLSGLYFYFKTN